MHVNEATMCIVDFLFSGRVKLARRNALYYFIHVAQLLHIDFPDKSLLFFVTKNRSVHVHV